MRRFSDELVQKFDNLKYFCEEQSARGCVSGRDSLKLFPCRFSGLFKRKIGFTLAEVLVTLGVIGVVSALTVPTLVKNHQKKTFVVQLHKVYSEIQQASENYMNDHNAVSLREAGLTSRASVADFLHSYFKVVKTCDEGDKRTPCFADKYSSMDKSTTSNAGNFTWNAASCVTLASGATVMTDYPTLYTEDVNGVTSYFGRMLIDVNGPSGPNIGGRDLFYLSFYDDGSLDVEGVTPPCRQQGSCDGSSVKDVRENLYTTSCQSSYFGIGCFGKILNDNWEMNY